MSSMRFVTSDSGYCLVEVDRCRLIDEGSLDAGEVNNVIINSILQTAFARNVGANSGTRKTSPLVDKEGSEATR